MALAHSKMLQLFQRHAVSKWGRNERGVVYLGRCIRAYHRARAREGYHLGGAALVAPAASLPWRSTARTWGF
jgi:hypothetical protein